MRLPISVKAVVLCDGLVALLRNERDEWELPGGRLEADETPEQCVVREVSEELGWDVTPLELVDAWVYTIRPESTVFIVTYGTRPLRDQEPVVSCEHTEARLFPLTEIDGLAMPDGYKRSIRTWAGLTRQGE